MFKRAKLVTFTCEDSKRLVIVTFEDGKVKEFDMSQLFDKYPQLKALEDKDLFLSGYLQTPYGVVWNDDLDFSTTSIYFEGTDKN